MSVPGSYTVKMETEIVNKVTNERKEEEKVRSARKKRGFGLRNFPFLSF